MVLGFGKEKEQSLMQHEKDSEKRDGGPSPPHAPPTPD